MGVGVVRCVRHGVYGDTQRTTLCLRGEIRGANPLKHIVIVNGGNYLTDCAAPGTAFAATHSEERSAFTVAYGEMPPGACPELRRWGQHDIGGAVWCGRVRCGIHRDMQ